jgi:hypothetical protein
LKLRNPKDNKGISRTNIFLIAAENEKKLAGPSSSFTFKICLIDRIIKTSLNLGKLSIFGGFCKYGYVGVSRPDTFQIFNNLRLKHILRTY